MTRQPSFKVWFGVGLKKKNTSHDTKKKKIYIHNSMAVSQPINKNRIQPNANDNFMVTSSNYS